MHDYLDDTDITATPGVTEINHPDYIGVVSGAQYKLDSADGVTEYALVVIQSGDVFVFETSAEDLSYLAKQIGGLVDLSS